MAKEKLGSLMSDLRSICEKKERYAKGLDEKSSALPEVQETYEEDDNLTNHSPVADEQS